MSDQLAFLPERVFTAAALPGAGFRVEFFQSGTTTPVTVYASLSPLVAHPSPLICDANGVFPAVFSLGGAIKAVITKPDGSSFYTLDPVFRVATSASGATEITFEPTVDLPFTNVQDAIEGAAASAAGGFTPFGLGVTGVNALIANLDATGTASGSYRFDNTTTGTFPTGVVATDTGTVQIWRENASDAVMWLQSGAADRQFTRRMATSVWGAWREVITVNQGAVEGDTMYRTSAAWTRLAKGTAYQVQAMNAGATVPEWATLSPIIASWDWSANVANVPLIDLAGWDTVLVEGNFDAGQDILIQVSNDNGSTWRTTGYVSECQDQISSSGRTTGFLMSRAVTVSSRFIFRATLSRLSDASRTTLCESHNRVISRSAVQMGEHSTLEAHTAIRLIGDSATTFTAGSVRVIGIRRA